LWLRGAFNIRRQGVPDGAKYRPPPTERGWVGLVFIQDSRGDFYVNLLLAGGPAEYSGKIQQGDKLRFIDDVDIMSLDKRIDVVVSIPKEKSFPFQKEQKP
jgi:hypothetical protein